MISVEKVKGVGSRTSMLLKKLNINTVDDLVTHYPYRYEFIKRSNLKEKCEDDKVIIDGKVEMIPILVRLKGNLNKMNFRLATSTKEIVGVSIFNRAYLKNQLLVGTNITVFGKYEKNKNAILASEIRMGLLPKGEKIEAVYHGTVGLNSKAISSFINTALMEYGNELEDYIPKYLLEKYNFLNKKTALNIIHNPSTKEKLKEASIRLKYEELFVYMAKINYLKLKNKNIKDGIEKNFDKEKLDKVIKSLPYELTVDQKLVLNEILEDLTSKRRMNRLLQGDVGSGKTIISIIAMVANYLSGYQSALMVPTEILATQHYETMKEILKDLNVNIALLTGSLPKNKKDLIHEELKLGKIDMVVGTHALIQEEVVYKNLGLVITDEQHRFGVLQRTSLQNKGIMPDVLYMSATPIPRTYALTLYGDMDISTIRTLPKGRKPIKTYLKSYSEIKDVLKMMYEELLKNHQIYVIAPLIEESETLDLTTVNELKDKMNLAFGEKYNVGIIHGKLKQTEKDKIMEDFVNNKIQILISTTVIEVGVNVLNTTMMVIFDANRFGLSTLHQLRGRVGRSALESSCILISDYDSERLNVMTTTNDGFEISEEDFKIRGHGDLFGTKQSGDMTFKIADIKEDYKILLQAKKDSMDFLLNNKEEELKEKIINGIKEG
ncbi:MAG: ATP-dependent DNA helicase RecG [Tenericutes bacterium]|nr:ATP-dependent DNA helicase RecG [Mycoplasmatota bacterium]